MMDDFYSIQFFVSKYMFFEPTRDILKSEISTYSQKYTNIVKEHLEEFEIDEFDGVEIDVELDCVEEEDEEPETEVEVDIFLHQEIRFEEDLQKSEQHHHSGAGPDPDEAAVKKLVQDLLY